MNNDAVLEQPLIRIGSEVTRRVRQHARAHMQAEVCGVLIGKSGDGVVEIEAPIEAFSAAQAGAHVTFTQAAWEAIYRVKDKQYPQERIVGWYHSHPGFGVFLSDHDTFIHQNFFASPDQVAWVYDPHSDEEGCFGWGDGSIRRLASIHVADTNGECRERAREQAADDMEVFEANMPHPVTGTRAEVPSLTSRNRPGLRSWFAVPLKKRVTAWAHSSRSLLFSFVPANRRTSLSGDAVSSGELPLGSPAPCPDHESEEATGQLPTGSGK